MITVLCHGCFDILHPGHIAHLEQAKAMGNRLVVSITSDRYVSKGPGRPVHSEAQRAAQVRALRCVDEVIICDDPRPDPAILQVRPDVYVKGPDYADGSDPEYRKDKALVESLGGRVVITTGPTESSSRLANLLASTLSPEAQMFAGGVRERYGADGVLGWLDRAAQLTAVVVGEPITDRYVHVEPQGKTAKENLISYLVDGSESWDGGATLVAAQMAAVCRRPSLVRLGRHYEITRHLWQPFTQKVFEEHRLKRICPPVNEQKGDADILAVADFGRGAFQDGSLPDGWPPPAWLALMVQTNSGNWGFNLLTKWRRCDFFVADENELRLATGMQRGHPDALLASLHLRMAASVSAVTLGHQGALLTDGERFVPVPPLAVNMVDRMGAGDTFYAVATPLARVGAPLEVIGLVASVASAIHVGVVGNPVSVTRKGLQGWLKGILA